MLFQIKGALMAPGMFSSYNKMGCQEDASLTKSKEKSQGQGAMGRCYGGSQYMGSVREGRLGEKRGMANKAINL